MSEYIEPSITKQQASTLLTMNAVFGSIFAIALIATITMLVRRDISDPFMSRSIYCLVFALSLAIVMCFMITSYQPGLYVLKSTIPF